MDLFFFYKTHFGNQASAIYLFEFDPNPVSAGLVFVVANAIAGATARGALVVDFKTDRRTFIEKRLQHSFGPGPAVSIFIAIQVKVYLFLEKPGQFTGITGFDDAGHLVEHIFLLLCLRNRYQGQYYECRKK